MRTSILHNSKGIAFVTSLMVITVLILLSAGYMISLMTEFNTAKRYQDNTKALWLDEAGLAYYIKNPTMLDSAPQTQTFSSGSVYISKDDSSGSRLVTFLGTVNGTARRIKVTFPPTPPDVFNNTMASGHNIVLNGLLATLKVYGTTKISGTYSQTGFLDSGWFESKTEGVASAQTTLKFPDSNGNGTPDEFNDFKAFYQNLASTYAPSEVAYIQNSGTVNIYPNSYLAGKKLIYVEGATAGSGNISILFDASWKDNENVTVVSTGNITYLQPLQYTANSKMNMVAWDNYNEASVLSSKHNGVTYAHSDADYFSVFSLSTTTGNVIANGNINATEALTDKRFYYNNPVSNGQVPPGFEGLVSQSASGFQTKPSLWQEI